MNADALGNFLDAGWEVAGYSVCMADAGALVHNILLRYGRELKTITVVTQAGRETGRIEVMISR